MNFFPCKTRFCPFFLLLNCVIVSSVSAQTEIESDNLPLEKKDSVVNLKPEFLEINSVKKYSRQSKSKMSALLRQLKGNQNRKKVALDYTVSIKEKIQKIEADNNINLETDILNLPNKNAIASSQMAEINNDEQTLEELRQELKISPKVILSKQTYSPSLSAGIPSAFGASWGDTFIGFSGATAGKERNNVDGSITLGFGLGDSYNLAGLTFAYNIGSIRNFGSNGTFDLQGSRVVYADQTKQVAAAIGWSSFGQYGSESTIPSTLWGEITSVTLLNPEDSVNKLPLLLSVGVGGGYFSGYDGSTSAFGGVGLQVAPQLGLGLAWSGVGLNVGLSFVPVPTIPLTLTATGGDLTNTSEGGSRFILSVTYGYNFIPRNY
jgi:hypothetical protein